MRIYLQLFAQERTEPATPRRREEARRKGQVAKTAELSSALILVAVFGTLYFWAIQIAKEVRHFTVMTFEQRLASASSFEAENVPVLLTEMSLLVAKVIAPLLGVAVCVALFTQVVQVGFLASFESIKPQFKRINPLSGLKRILSKRAVMELVKSTMKIALVAYIAYTIIKGNITTILNFPQMAIVTVVAYTGKLVFQIGLWVGLTMLGIAILDYVFQRWEFERSIRMSKQEVREELRQSDGDPQIRSKIRQRQRQIAGMRMMSQVPTADVVVTNPVHLAVALRYDEETMDAPMVVAKGAGPLAERIKQAARDHNVSVVENVWLARSLYETAELNSVIPEDLYQAVAEVLAFVYRLKRAGASG